MRNVILAATALVAGSLLPATAGAVTIANPSFESFSANPGANFVTLSGNQLPGWTIESGTIDHVGGLWMPQDGALSIDLDGNSPAVISQTLSGLSAGTEYIVSFFISGNPDGPDEAKIATLSLGSTANLVSYTLTAANTRGNMLWQQVNYSFVAGGSTALLRLASNSEPTSPFGLAVDNFAISAAPEPAAWAMMIFGFGIAGTAIRRRRNSPKLVAA